MKPGHSLTLGSAIAGCAAALAVYLAATRSSTVHTPQQAVTANPQSAPVGTKRNFTPSATQSAPDMPAATAANPSRDQEVPEFRIHGKPPAQRVTDEREWFASAERIERQANRELATLRETLDLTPQQQQRIFDTLARNSPFWQPGMWTGGSHGIGVGSDPSKPAANRSQPARRDPAPSLTADPSAPGELPSTGTTPSASVTDELIAVLDYDQQQALIEEELNRRAWWEEVLPQLLPPDFPAADLPLAGDTKDYEGPTELLEE